MNAFEDGDALHVDLTVSEINGFPFFAALDGKRRDLQRAASRLTRWSVNLADASDAFSERRKVEPSTPMGGRVYLPVPDGKVQGPRLNGRVLPNRGADWARGRSDGVAELNAHTMLEADDGTPIYLYNRGYLYGRDENGLPLSAAEWQRRGNSNFAIKPNTYFYITPVFDAPVGPHDWLTRTVIVGRGQRRPDPDHSVFDYYSVG